MNNEKLDFHYSLKYDYNTETHHEEDCCDGICRCGTIEDFELKEIESWEVILHTLEQHFRPFSFMATKKKTKIDMPEEVFQYGLDRIARHYKLYDINGYDADIQHSYYGEEVMGVYHKDNDAIIKTLDEFVRDKNPIEFLIILEYGKLLPSLIDRKWNLVKVPYDTICECSAGQRELVKKTENPYKEDYKGVVALCIQKGRDKKLHLIDGYHRLDALKGKKTIQVFVGEKV